MVRDREKTGRYARLSLPELDPSRRRDADFAGRAIPQLMPSDRGAKASVGRSLDAISSIQARDRAALIKFTDKAIVDQAFEIDLR